MFGLQIRYLSFFFVLITVLSFFNIIYSYYLNLYLYLNTYYTCFVISLIISVLFYKIKVPEEKINMGSLSFQNSGNCFEQIQKIKETYNIGGVFNWEYFDVNPKGNDWANNMDLILNKTKNETLDNTLDNTIESLETGDLILFSGNVGVVDMIIKFFTWSKWTHVGIVLKDPTYISEELKGHYLLECGYNSFENVDHNTRYGVQLVDLKEKLSTFEGEAY